MGWLEDAKSILEELECIAAKKGTGLSIDSMESLPDDYSGIKSISFSPTYSGPPIETFLPEIVQQAKDLESLGIVSQKISWAFACSLNLRNIQNFSFSLNGDVTSERLNAPKLKKLCIFGFPSLAPLELLIHPCPHIDFSSMQSLESLELKHFQQIDPNDFRSVAPLKKLSISDADITNLNWLKDASYKLETLCLDGPVDNCDGIIYQPFLKNLYLFNHYISDATAIENLKELKKLDLHFANPKNETALRMMNLEELIINHRDCDISRIKNQVRDLVRQAIFEYRGQNKKAEKIEELPVYQRPFLLQRIEKPFEVRMKSLIQHEFSKALRRIEEQEKVFFFTVSKAEYRRIFIGEALKYCPFLTVEK